MSPILTMNKSPLLLTLATCQLLAGTSFALTPFSDKFDAATLSGARWKLNNYAKAKLAPGDKVLNFIVASKPTEDDYSILELKNNRPGYNESWEMTLDVSNAANQGYNLGVGFQIYNAADPTDVAALEFYGKTGFLGIILTDDEDNPANDLKAKSPATKGSLKIGFNKTTKLITFSYDPDGSANGVSWKVLGTFSPTGKGGDRRANWKMNPASGSFGIQLYGFGQNRSIAKGKMALDNFVLKPVK
jgi:hypothetical protein